DHAMAMRIVQRTRHRPRDGYALLDRDLPLARDALAQRDAVYERHDVVKHILNRTRVDEAEYVGVGKSGGYGNLREEPIRPKGDRQVRPQHLDRYLPPVAKVVCRVDGGHPARAQLSLDPVPVPETGPERD